MVSTTHEKLASSAGRFACSVMLGSALLAGSAACALSQPDAAFADPKADKIYAAAEKAEEKVKETTNAYNESVDKVTELESQIEENEGRIAELEEQIPIQQEKSNDAARALYKFNNNRHNLIDLVFGVSDLDEFLDTISYIDHIQQKNKGEMQELRDMQADLTETRASLSDAKTEAYAEQKKAKQALKDAQAAREEAQAAAEAQRKKEEEEERERQRKAEEARRAAEQAAQEAAEAEAAAKAARNSDDSDDSEDSEQPAVQHVDISGVDWSMSEEDFVNSWADRIDSYLAGSSLSGQGKTFAKAAWKYGVDPRWSPAISCTESSRGDVCFKPYNAWGWGSSSWGSWEEAIDAHVSGLASGYGSTITLSAAKKYCPPTYVDWYNRTLGEMNKI